MLLAPGIVTLPSFFDIDEIDEIRSFIRDQEMYFGVTGGDGNTAEERMKAKIAGSVYRKSKVYFINRKKTYTCEPFVKFDAAIEYANKTYLKQPIGTYEVWDAYQYADYSEEYKGFYKIHKDNGGKDLQTRLLSASLQLTDPSHYVGGDLIIYANRKKITVPKDIGTITIFVSSLYHEVTPVTSGLRSSLVTWVR